MGKPSRDKGRRGAREALALLADRDWSTVETRDGKDTDDAVVISPEGQAYSLEIKNAVSMNIRAYLSQARTQAAKRKLPWMLLAKIDGGHGWLMLRKDATGQIWRDKAHKGEL